MSNEGPGVGKSCFVIGRIGDPGTEERKHADDLFDYIIIPAAEAAGMNRENVIRADRINSSGVITSEIVGQLEAADIVVADLSGRNANAFYELAIRHLLKKPFVHMIQAGEAPPFDVGTVRAISFDTHDLKVAHEARETLAATICVELQKDPSKIETPFTVALDSRALAQASAAPAGTSAEMAEIARTYSALTAACGNC